MNEPSSKWPPSKIDEVLGMIGAGQSQPRYGLADGIEIVIKTQKFTGQKKTLPREFFVGLLAKEVECPVPEMAVLKLPNNHPYNTPLVPPLRSEYVFVTKRMRGKQWLRRQPNLELISKTENKAAFTAMLVLDMWTWNGDRFEDGNTFFEEIRDGVYRVVAVDQGNCLVNSRDEFFNATDRRPKDQFDCNWVPSFLPEVDYKSLPHLFSRLGKVSVEKINDAIDAVRSDWEMSPQDRAFTKSFLFERAEHLSVHGMEEIEKLEKS